MAVVTDRYLTPHALYESQHPDEAEMAQRYAQHREAQHVRSHGSLDGFRPEREFPCPGVLRAVESFAPGLFVVQCDSCGWETTARLSARAEPARDPAPF